ncbi:MAG: 30S ribosomal protein S18 [Microgenomates group bacterium]
MAKKSKKRRFQKVIEAPLNSRCPFCVAKTTPDYKDIDNLSKFLNDRAKIMGKDRSGVCSKHQRRLTLAVKRARHLALLPFVPSLS